VIALLGLAGLVLLSGCNRPRAAREAALRTNLRTLRDVIGQYHEDKASYPDSLDRLVRERYFRMIPDDPLTRRADTWILERESGPSGGIVNLRSGAPGKGLDGTPYRSW
jgi:general secretion pathway protein G